MHTVKFADGCEVVVGPHVVSIENGAFHTNANVDYYYEKGRGYGCRNESEVAETFHNYHCPRKHRR